MLRILTDGYVEQSDGWKGDTVFWTAVNALQGETLLAFISRYP
jgi:hypothetical protein